MSTEDLSFFKEEDFKQNLALYEQMIQGGRPVYLEADELTDIAEYYLVRNQQEKAMRCIEYALDIHPDSVDPMIFLARQKMFNGEMEAAKTIRDSITDQNDREVIFLNAELLLREGKEDEAQRYLAQWSENEEEEEMSLFAYDCACLFIDYGIWEYAAQWGETALGIEPDNEKFLRLKADILLTADRPQEAIDVLNNILDADPYDTQAWHTLSEAYFAIEDFAKTLDSADFALAIDEHDEYAMLLKANCLLHQQCFEEAHRLYTSYLNENQTNELPYMFDGICLLASEHYDEALVQLLHAEEIAQGTSQEQLHIYANIAEAYSALHRPEKAFEYVDKILGIDPDYDADLYKAHILVENGRKAEGMTFYERFISRHPNPAEAHFFTAVSLAENNAYDEAREHFSLVTEQGLSQNRDNHKVNAYMAYCALMQNRFEEFLPYLEKACREDPDSLVFTVGKYIPPEVEPKDFYQYVLTHPDRFVDFHPDKDTTSRFIQSRK